MRTQGRPFKSDDESLFKSYVNKHLPRNMLECKVISNIYQLFFHESSTEFTDEHMRNLFDEHRQQELYAALQRIYSIPGTTVPPEKLSDYTSSKDILYLLSGCHDILGRVKADSTQKKVERVITAKQLHLLLQFFIHKNRVMNVQAASWMANTYDRFVQIMRKGPNPPADEDPSYTLLELLARWAIELASLRHLLISFPLADRR